MLRLRLQKRSFKSTRLQPFEAVAKRTLFRRVFTTTIYPFSWLLRYGRDRFGYQRSGDYYTLITKCRHFVLKMGKRKDVSNFICRTGDEVEFFREHRTNTKSIKGQKLLNGSPLSCSPKKFSRFYRAKTKAVLKMTPAVTFVYTAHEALKDAFSLFISSLPCKR